MRVCMYHTQSIGQAYTIGHSLDLNMKFHENKHENANTERISNWKNKIAHTQNGGAGPWVRSERQGQFGEQYIYKQRKLSKAPFVTVCFFIICWSVPIELFTVANFPASNSINRHNLWHLTSESESHTHTHTDTLSHTQQLTFQKETIAMQRKG